MNPEDSRICWIYELITNSDLTNQKIEFPLEIAEKFIGKLSPFLEIKDKLTLKTFLPLTIELTAPLALSKSSSEIKFMNGLSLR
jgi:hypothetical protein